MATAYSEFTSMAATGLSGVAADVKNAILQSSDWAHLLISGAVNTTLSATAAAGSTTVTTVASIAAGAVVTFDPGSANQECLAVASVSGAGPFTLTLVGNDGLGTRLSHSSGVTVQAGGVVKATTTRGAQMVVDLTDTTPTNYRLNLAIYRTHDGTTGVDKILRYLPYNTSGGGNTSDPVHCVVSSGKEHLYVWTHGPYAGEQLTGTGGTVAGISLFLGDIVPYFAGDTTAAVALSCNDTGVPTSGTNIGWVSRDAANANSWVAADIVTLARPAFSNSTSQLETSLQSLAAGDSNYYMWPFVVVERTAGLRGRISKCFMLGWYNGTAGWQVGLGNQFTFASETYQSVPVAGSYQANVTAIPVGLAIGFQTTMPVIAVPHP